MTLAEFATYSHRIFVGTGAIVLSVVVLLLIGAVFSIGTRFPTIGRVIAFLLLLVLAYFLGTIITGGY